MKELSVAERVFIAIILGLGAFGIVAVLDYYHNQLLALGAIALLVTMTLTFLFELMVAPKAGAEAVVELIYGKDKLLDLYQTLKDEAESVCYLVWAGDYGMGTNRLTKYFDQENQTLIHRQRQGNRLDIFRLISKTPKNVSPQDYQTHIHETDESHKAGVYRYLQTSIKHYELAYIDVRDPEKGKLHKGVFVMLNTAGVPEVGFLFDGRRSDRSNEFAGQLRDLFAYSWKQASGSEDL